MAKSPSPGSSSSVRPVLEADALARLAEIAQSESLTRIQNALGAAAQLALVGGTVRDALVGKSLTDLDLTTKLLPAEALALLTAKGIKVVETGLQHGTITAVFDKEHIEITTYRIPGARSGSGYSDTLETDLAGRDFSINAIAFDLATGALIDPNSGAEDLRNAVLRCVGNAETRFNEDPLRILRMIRFGPAADRTVVPETAAAAKKLCHRLIEVSPERIRAELERILLSPNPREAFRSMERLGILAVILPEALPSVGCEQNEFHINDVFEHTLDVISACPPERLLRLVGLFHDLGKPATLSTDEDGRRHFYLHERVSSDLTRKIMERLRFSTDETRRIAHLVNMHMRPLTCGPQGARRLMRELGEDLDLWLEFKRADKTPTSPEADLERDLTHFLGLVQAEKERTKGSVYGKLAVNGDDLIALGLTPGKRLGTILKLLEEDVIEDPNLNDREVLLERASRYMAN